MKYKKLAALLFLFTLPASAQTPALVQHDSSSNMRSNSHVSAMKSPYCYHFQLPDPTSQGNAVIVGFQYQGNGFNPTVSDDRSDAYTIAQSFFDGADNRTLAIAAAFNVAAGARNIKLCFNADPGGFEQPMVSEFSNVTGIDGAASGNTGSGTTITAGNLTPSMTGDLVYQIAASFGNNLHQTSFTTGSQANLSWSLLSASLNDGWAGQSGVYSSTNDVDPTMSMGASGPWASVAILLKAGSAGAVPGGMRIVHLQHENVPTKVGGGGTGSGYPNPSILQFPSVGNLLVAVSGGGGTTVNQYITSITDNKGNAWVRAGPTPPFHNGGNDVVTTWYAANAASGADLALTATWNGNTGDSTILLYDVVGAASSPFVTSNGEGGDSQTNATGSYTPPYTVTPTAAGQLIFTNIIWDLNTAVGLSATNGNGFFDANMYDGESVDGPCPLDENNGWGHVWVTNPNPVSFTWAVFKTNEVVSGTASIATVFKAATSAVPPAPPTDLKAVVQ